MRTGSERLQNVLAVVVVVVRQEKDGGEVSKRVSDEGVDKIR